MQAEQRDHELLETAFARHRGFVRQRMAALGVPRSDLDDATQDVFLVMARRLADFDRGRAIRSWAAGIARRVARRYRGAPGRSVISLEEIDEQRAWEEHDPEVAARRREALRMLEQFLRELDEDRWKVFVLAELEGLRVTEIAGELGINLNTAYARLKSARRDFARALRRHHAKQSRRLPALLPFWLVEHRRPVALGVMGLASLGALVVAVTQLRGCGGGSDPTQSAARSVDAEPVRERRPHRAAESRRPLPFVEVRGHAEPGSSSMAGGLGSEPVTEWVDAGSGHSGGDGWAASRNARYRIVDDTAVELELEYVMDQAAIDEMARLQAHVLGGDADEIAQSMQGNDMGCVAAEILTEGLEVVEGTDAWTMALAPGETKRITARLEPTRDGVVRAAVSTQSCTAAAEDGGGTSTHLRFVVEDGEVHPCTEDDACGSWTTRLLESETPTPERTVVEAINECPDRVRFVVRPDDRPAEPSDPTYALAPGESRTIEIEATHWFSKFDDDGNPSGGVWASGEDVRLQFRTPECAMSISSGSPPPTD